MPRPKRSDKTTIQSVVITLGRDGYGGRTEIKLFSKQQRCEIQAYYPNGETAGDVWRGGLEEFIELWQELRK